MNQYVTVGTTTYGYDLDGNLTSKAEGTETTNYTYDAENRLVGVANPSVGTVQYGYDALGNRALAIHNGVALTFLSDPTDLVSVVSEYDGTGALLARYIHGPALVARENASGARQFFGYDALGHTALITDPTGTLSNHYTYDPFGRPLSIVEAFENRYQWVGREGVRADESGLSYMRARSYDSETGRFVSEDPIGVSGGWNLYTYVGNAPTTFTDPSGTLAPGSTPPPPPGGTPPAPPPQCGQAPPPPPPAIRCCPDDDPCCTKTCQPGDCAVVTCSPDYHCVSAPMDCDDGNPCNGHESCAGGSCVPGTPLDCDDHNDCTADVCAGDSGQCSNPPLPFGAACQSASTPAGADESCVDRGCNGTGRCVAGRLTESSPGGRCPDHGCLQQMCVDGVCTPVQVASCPPVPPPHHQCGENVCLVDPAGNPLGCRRQPRNEGGSCDRNETCTAPGAACPCPSGCVCFTIIIVDPDTGEPAHVGSCHNPPANLGHCESGNCVAGIPGLQ